MAGEQEMEIHVRIKADRLMMILAQLRRLSRTADRLDRVGIDGLASRAIGRAELCAEMLEARAEIRDALLEVERIAGSGHAG